MSMRKDQRGTWPQALGSLALSLAVILGIRWAFFEPYVIPSGSMLPTLLIHDHILVNKFSYGIHLPFSTRWLVRFSEPQRGDVIVFRSVGDDGTFLIKRVIGLPGDEVAVFADGRVVLNGQELRRERLTREAALRALEPRVGANSKDLLEGSDLFRERVGLGDHWVLQSQRVEFTAHVVAEPATQTAAEPAVEPQFKVRVPQGECFMMGDNRDHSSDSRYWGTLPIDRMLGRAVAIWLSCEETLPDANQMCDPHTVRWQRVFTRLSSE